MRQSLSTESELIGRDAQPHRFAGVASGFRADWRLLFWRIWTGALITPNTQSVICQQLQECQTLRSAIHKVRTIDHEHC